MELTTLTIHRVDVFEYPADGGPYRTDWAAVCLEYDCDWSSSVFSTDREARYAAGSHGTAVA